jgi:hypothetical protein
MLYVWHTQSKLKDYITKRFEVISIQGTFEAYRVMVDKETGVNYLYVSNGTSGGLTVLLDSESLE